MRQGLASDIPSEVFALELNLLGNPVRDRYRLLKRGSNNGHTKHTTSVRAHLIAELLCTGVVDYRSWNIVGRGEAGVDLSCLIRVVISARRKHNGSGGPRVPVERLKRV